MKDLDKRHKFENLVKQYTELFPNFELIELQQESNPKSNPETFQESYEISPEEIPETPKSKPKKFITKIKTSKLKQEKS
jgi:hypothetical protein